MAKFFGNRMKDKVEKREELIIPTYTLQKKHKKIPKWAVITSGVVLVIFSTIYLPPLLIAEPDTTTRGSVDASSIADIKATETAIQYMRNNPEADFDNDGLTNEQELSANTGVYIIDNDDDGTTDYAELYLTETNPCVKDDSIINFVVQADAKTGNTVNTPFKVHDVVMWADDYESKARGGVIQLSDGSYNFYRFKGWVQFPTTVESAYKVVNGTQQALKKNENGYFYIDSTDLTNVRIYDKQPATCYIVSLLGTRYSLPDNAGSKILNFILPSHGFGLITCKPALMNDLDETWNEVATSNSIVTMKLGEYAESRFGRDQQSLSNLSQIFREIDKGNNVIISLMSHEVGEVFLEVYGYTNRNNLLVCDPKTGESFGVININVINERVLDQSGSISSYEHFTFSGCGYSSAARHRFMIVDYVATDASTETPPVVDEDEYQSSTEDSIPDDSFVDGAVEENQ